MRYPTVAAEVRDRVARSRDRFWRPEDFEGSPDAVAQALSRLERSGDLRRIRRGLYWRGASTPLGMAPPPAHRLAGEVIGEPGIGPAEWSAGLALGLSTQVPRREVIAVPGRVPRSLGAIRFVSRGGSTGRRDEKLRPLEVALLEVLRDWGEFSEVPIPEAVSRINQLAKRGDLRLDRVIRASVTEPPRVRERLRRLLGALDRASDADRVPPARSRSVRGDLAMAG